MNRFHDEMEFHDQQADERSRSFGPEGESFHFSDEAYLTHESWIEPAMAMFGDVRGRRLLDYGCGHGMASVVLAHRGALMTAFDLSHGYLIEARQRAHANRADVHFVQADGQRLPFADQSFEGIWGNAVLHHLDMEIAGIELLRVLRPGGIAVFCEPLGDNPLLNLARSKMPYPGKQRTTDEQPLSHRDIDTLRQIFPTVHVRGFQLLSMIRRVLHWKGLISRLDRWDNRILTGFPGLQRWCRYVVISLQRS